MATADRGAQARRPQTLKPSRRRCSERLAAVLGDLVRTPRRQPHPVDPEVADQSFQGGPGLVLDHVRERAGRAGQGHVDGRHPVLGDVYAVDQAKIDHVDAELRVDDVAHRLQDVLGLGGGQLAGSSGGVLGHLCSSSARAVASFQAIQPSRAHLIRAGYLDTPSNATASPSTSSFGSAAPRDCLSFRNSALTSIASLSGRPMIASASTEVLAWLIEQPSASYDTSATAGSPPASFSATRSVTSSPHVGLT